MLTRGSKELSQRVMSFAGQAEADWVSPGSDQ